MGKYRHSITILCLVCLVFFFFGKTLDHDFNSDDYLAINHALNDQVSSPVDAVAEFAKPSWGLYYRPIIKFFFDALARSFGLWPRGYHLISLICYSLLCLEVYIIALLLTEKWSVATAAAAIFMASGSHGEALFWISSLNGVVENVLSLATIILFFLWRQKNKRVFFTLSVVLFALALLTKESAISVPIILVLYDFLLAEETGWMGRATRAARGCWLFVAVGLGFIILRSVVMKQAHHPPPLVTFEWHMLLAGPWYSLIMTLSPVSWPWALGWFDTIAGTRVNLYLIITTIIMVLTIVPLALRRFDIAFLVLWILAGAAPLFALGLFPAERHVVLSSAGAAALLSAVFFQLSEKLAPKSAPFALGLGFAFAAAFALPNGYTLIQRQTAWGNASYIARDTVEQTLAAYPDPVENTTFFFMNVPDSVNGAFVFRFDNLQTALRMYYEDASLEAIRIVEFDKIPLVANAGNHTVYFNIAAMGGNVYIPGEYVEGPDQPIKWQKLSRLGILGKNFRYSGNWKRYRTSPFLLYSYGVLLPQSPDKLKTVVDNLYSLR